METIIMIKMIMLLFIVVFVIDISGIIESIKRLLWRIIAGKREYQNYRIKPFDCSLCMTFWTISLYSIYNDIDVIQSIFCGTLFAFISMFVSYLLRKIIGLIF